MGELMSALTNSLSERGAEIHFESRFEIPEVITTPIVLATSAWQASELLKSARPKLATKLAHVESLPLLSVTCFFKHGNKDLRGFGCLFPRRQKFHSLGVLFNDCIFAGRARAGIRSETWILGGAHNRDIAAVSDDEILRRILQDRGRLGGDDVPPLDYKIQRWTRALPHYTCDWAKHLEDVHDDPPIYLHGNYLGEIGLSRIYARSIRLAVQLKASYG
jgi:oxygen-dependent protoporphyrinogen oxidase